MNLFLWKVICFHCLLLGAIVYYSLWLFSLKKRKWCGCIGKLWPLKKILPHKALFETSTKLANTRWLTFLSHLTYSAGRDRASPIILNCENSNVTYRHTRTPKIHRPAPNFLGVFKHEIPLFLQYSWHDCEQNIRKPSSYGALCSQIWTESLPTNEDDVFLALWRLSLVPRLSSCWDAVTSCCLEASILFRCIIWEE